MFKKSFLITFSRLYRNILSVVFVIIISRVLSMEQYGNFKQSILIANIINLVFQMGMGEAISYYYKNLTGAKRNQLITAVYAIKFLACIITIIVLNFTGDLLSQQMSNENIAGLTNVIALIACTFIFSSILEPLYISSERVKFLTISTIGIYSVYYAVAIIVVLLRQNEFDIIYLCLIAEMVRVVLLLFVFNRREKIKIDFNFVFLKKLIIFILPIGIAVVIVTLNREIDKIMISFIFGVREFALYNNAIVTLPIIEFITISAGTVIFPIMAEKKHKGDLASALELFRKTATYCAMILYPIVFILFFFGEGYILFMFSEKYILSYDIMRVYIMRSIVFIGLYSNLAIIADKRKVVLLSAVISLVINIVLNLLFIKWFGMIGAAYASVFAQVLADGIVIFGILKVLKVNIKMIIEMKKVFHIILICASICFLFKRISMLFEMNSIYSFFIFGLVSALSIGALYMVLGLVKKEEIKSIFNK